MRAPCSSVPAADLVVVVGGVGFEVVEVVGAVGVELGVPAEARERDVGHPERVAQVVDDADQSNAVGGPGGDGPPDPLPERRLGILRFPSNAGDCPRERRRVEAPEVGAGVDDGRECRVPLPEGIEKREVRNIISFNYRYTLYR